MQQPVTGVCMHMCALVLQVSVVHGLVSSQSPSAWQHPATGECVHDMLVQTSCVQGFVSSHCRSEVQQAVIGVCVHVCSAVSQWSIVQASPSLQSESAMQQFIFWVCL